MPFIAFSTSPLEGKEAEKLNNNNEFLLLIDLPFVILDFYFDIG